MLHIEKLKSGTKLPKSTVLWQSLWLRWVRVSGCRRRSMTSLWPTPHIHTQFVQYLTKELGQWMSLRVYDVTMAYSSDPHTVCAVPDHGAGSVDVAAGL